MSTACRRAAILNYFGEAQPVQCTGCDVCDAAASADASNTEIHDFTADFRTVLELVMANKKNLTVNQIIAVLRGTKEGQKHCSGVGFGSGGSHNNKWWENVCNVMISTIWCVRAGIFHAFVCVKTLSITINLLWIRSKALSEKSFGSRK